MTYGDDNGSGFESARFLIEEIDSDLNEIKTLTEEYFRNNPYALVKEQNPINGDEHAKIVFRPVPSRIRYITSNVIKNLRDALDQACSAASEHIKGKRCRHAHFPFGENPDDFEVAITKSVCKDIPSELYPILRTFELYPTGEGYDGGNNRLRMLGRVSGPHKHRIAISAAPNIVPTLQCLEVFPGKNGKVIFHHPLQERKNNEFPLVTLGKGGRARFNLQMTGQLIFANTKLRDVPVREFLMACQGDVRKIVEELESEALRIK
ncbi:hypothetical protein [Novosphingobium olei]|uniref:hypothetical protein n=1 Tax=Novosphingobium olei TaxID=2728851 RepID=UPI00308C0F3E|nr:hypothetical protein NSDW_11820 [Novosphingobium olei]